MNIPTQGKNRTDTTQIHKASTVHFKPTPKPPLHQLTPEEIEAENKEIRRRYRLLLRHARPYLNSRKDTTMVRKAFNLAMSAHSNVRRKSGEPYIYHPLEVARIVVDEIGLGATSIVCALLHDVVEDTEYKLEDIEKEFGKKVSKSIDGLTKIKGAIEKGHSIQAENFRKMLLTITEDIRVVLVKIADRLHNMRTLDSMPKEKKLKIKSETQFIYAPLAHRLGLYEIKSELEDLCLKHTDPEGYDHIVEQLKKSKSARDKFVRSFVKPITEELKEHGGFEFEIKSRVKSVYSIWSKMKKQGVPFEEVFDLFAVRIIVDAPADKEREMCWQIYSMVTNNYRPNPNRMRDWISFPKANGYESLHTTVMSALGKWVEVQIRSKRMDEIAEKGLAAHWKYKDSSSKQDSSLEEWIKTVRESIEKQDTDALDFMDEFRANLFNNEVYVFTPKGDLKAFPAKATVLDFAFDVHSEIGIKCLGAKVNGKLVPLNHELTNGDQIEILTSTKPKANESWLKTVTTSKARSHIREHLRSDRKKHMTYGKEIIARKLKQMKLPMSSQVITELVDYFNTKSEPELYFQVGKGIIEHNVIKKFREQHERNIRDQKIHAESAKEFKSHMKTIKAKEEDVLVIGEDRDKIEYRVAKCCSPMPGDDIFGLVTINRGVSIHKTDCQNAVDLMAKFGHRIIRTRWASMTTELFDINLKVIGSDRVGLVSDVTKIISRKGLNITAITFSTTEGVFEGNISLAVHDLNEVNIVMDDLNQIQDILKVTRFDL